MKQGFRDVSLGQLKKWSKGLFLLANHSDFHAFDEPVSDEVRELRGVYERSLSGQEKTAMFMLQHTIEEQIAIFDNVTIKDIPESAYPKK